MGLREPGPVHQSRERQELNAPSNSRGAGAPRAPAPRELLPCAVVRGETVWKRRMSLESRSPRGDDGLSSRSSWATNASSRGLQAISRTVSDGPFSEFRLERVPAISAVRRFVIPFFPAKKARTIWGICPMPPGRSPARVLGRVSRRYREKGKPGLWGTSRRSQETKR